MLTYDHLLMETANYIFVHLGQRLQNSMSDDCAERWPHKLLLHKRCMPFRQDSEELRRTSTCGSL